MPNETRITAAQIDKIIDADCYTIKWWRSGCPKLRRDIFDDQEVIGIDVEVDANNQPQLDIYVGDRIGE